MPHKVTVDAVVVVVQACGGFGEDWGGRDGDGREDSWALQKRDERKGEGRDGWIRWW